MDDILTSEDNDICTKPPPFQGSIEDQIATRKRQRMFLLQSLRIAMRLSRNPVTLNMLESSLPWLEREQYIHLADERNALGNCGYPLCSKPRGHSPAQQYCIVYRARRVYDITDRKRFCSDWCYAAFNHVYKQIPCEPSWCRSPTDCPVTLSGLSRRIVPEPGELVLDALAHFNLENPSSDEDCETGRVANCDDRPHHLSGSRQRTGPTGVPAEVSWGRVKVTLPEHNLVVERKTESTGSSARETVQVSADEKDTIGTPLRTNDCLANVSVFLKQWLTGESIRLLTSSAEASHSACPVLPPMTMETLVDVRKTQSKQSSNIIPLIDSVSVNAVRRQMLMEELGPSIDRILSHLGLPRHTVSRRLDDAMNTFRLSNRNIHMPRRERLLSALALLCLMAVSDSLLVSLNDETRLLRILQLLGTGVSVVDFRAVCVEPFTVQLDFDSVD